MKQIPLTQVQRELLAFIAAHIKKKGVAPSTDAMRKVVIGTRATRIHMLTAALEHGGWIKRGPNGIEIVDRDAEAKAASGPTEQAWLIESPEAEGRGLFLTKLRMSKDVDFNGWTPDKNAAIRFKDQFTASRHAAWLRMGNMRVSSHAVSVSA